MQRYFRALGIGWIAFTFAVLFLGYVPYASDLGLSDLAKDPVGFVLAYTLAGLVLIVLDALWVKTSNKLFYYLSYIVFCYIVFRFLLLVLALLFVFGLAIFVVIGQVLFGP